MKKLLFFMMIFFSLRSLAQNTYYFAGNGNDSNNGKSASSPFKSINKLNQLNLQPGDKVLFNCNDTFEGQINIKNSGSKDNPILISSYGSGLKPIISGALSVHNWQKTPGHNGVWEASCLKDSAITDFYVDAQPLPLGRYPNANESNHGYLTIASHTGKTAITSKDQVNQDWKNAEIVFKPVEYLIEKPIIESQDGNTFQVKSEQFAAVNGWGYFIQNSINTLDSNGEWYFDTGAKKIFLFDNNDDPNQKKFDVTYFSKGISILNSNYITIQNIEISKTANTSIYADKSSDILLKNLTISNSGQDGIKIDGNCDNIKMEGNVIHHCNNNGVVVWNATNFTFTNNTIKGCGTIPGRGKSNNGTYIGFQYISKTGGAVIENNVIDSIGYNGVEFESPNVTVNQNVVSNFCLIKSDGGGIYTYNGNQYNYTNIKVTNNMVIGCHGDSISINHIRPHIHGIYIDDCSINIQISGNTVINNESSGIFLHGTSNITVENNTLYNNNVQYYNGYGKCDSKNNTINNNILVSKSRNQPVALHQTHNNNESLGNFSNNIYFSPDRDHMITVMPDNADQSKTKRLSLDSWKNQFNKDNSLTNASNQDWDPNSKTEIKYNPNKTPKTITLSGRYKDIKGNSVGNEITLQPFTSVVLVKQ
jgi:parallel beta-helix repeat protein